MKKGWTELGATWNATGNGANWQAVGANGTASPGQDRSATLLASLSNQTTGVKTVPFTTAGRDAVRNWQSTPSSNHGVLLRSHVGDAVSSCDDHVWISSRETASKPHLEIDWEIPAASMTASCPVLQDTNIRQRTPDTSYATYAKGWAHSAVDGTAGSWVEALLRFDLSSCLPAGANVSSANLHLYVTNASAYPFEFYEMLRPFSATATWNAYTSGTSWTSHGAMGAGSDFGVRLATIQSAPLGSVTIPLSTAIVEAWVGSANRSIVVRPVGAPGTNNAPVGFGFRSSEHTSGSPPLLKVVYSTKSTTDTTPPAISNVVVTAGTTTATIRWSTNESANGRVSYGRTVSYGTNTPLSAGGLTAHMHTLQNLIVR